MGNTESEALDSDYTLQEALKVLKEMILLTNASIQAAQSAANILFSHCMRLRLMKKQEFDDKNLYIQLYAAAALRIGAKINDQGIIYKKCLDALNKIRTASGMDVFPWEIVEFTNKIIVAENRIVYSINYNFDSYNWIKTVNKQTKDLFNQLEIGNNFLELLYSDFSNFYEFIVLDVISDIRTCNTYLDFEISYGMIFLAVKMMVINPNHLDKEIEEKWIQYILKE